MKRFARRRFLHLATGAAASCAVSRIAEAVDYPARPVRWIVPMASGDMPDILARLMGQWLSERLGQPVIIDNRPGAATNIGTEAATHAPNDGSTLVLLGPPFEFADTSKSGNISTSELPWLSTIACRGHDETP
jgi:tripartite-type tricarboxylate transporter receptor subunit TctC